MDSRLDRRAFTGRGRREEGVVLMIALIVLVAMTLAGLGIIRSIDTGTMVAGNIGFRQSAVATADSGIEAARAWLIANSTTLDADNPAAGYYSTRQDNLDLTGNLTSGGSDGVNWGGSDPTQTVTAFDDGTPDSTGNHVYYLIHRLCSVPGSINLSTQSCATSTQNGIGSSQDAPDYSSYGLKDKNQIYYRVTSRVDGPKNTVSYVQAVILL
jgi:type IV pilus assembly protein PilX